jgi:hypothetical protein
MHPWIDRGRPCTKVLLAPTRTYGKELDRLVCATGFGKAKYVILAHPLAESPLGTNARAHVLRR